MFEEEHERYDSEAKKKEFEELAKDLRKAKQQASKKSVLKARKPSDLPDWLIRSSAASFVLCLAIMVEAVMVLAALESLAQSLGVDVTLVPPEAVQAALRPWLTRLDLLDVLLTAFLGFCWYRIGKSYDVFLLRIVGLVWIILSALTMLLVSMSVLPVDRFGLAQLAYSVSPIVFAGASANLLIWAAALASMAVGTFALERRIKSGSFAAMSLLFVIAVFVGLVIIILLIFQAGALSWLYSTERKQKVIRGV